MKFTRCNKFVISFLKPSNAGWIFVICRSWRVKVRRESSLPSQVWCVVIRLNKYNLPNPIGELIQSMRFCVYASLSAKKFSKWQKHGVNIELAWEQIGSQNVHLHLALNCFYTWISYKQIKNIHALPITEMIIASTNDNWNKMQKKPYAIWVGTSTFF